jgi:hypothetical protein
VTPVGALEASALGAAMRDSAWLYPLAEIVHTVGIALLFGSLAVLDLRLLGVWKKVAVKPLAAQVLPWTAASFFLILPSGVGMFIAHAGDLIASDLFALKMCLILAAGTNAALFYAITFRTVDVWDAREMRDLRPPVSARLAGLFSLLLWISVIACGRLLAYT